MREVTAQELSDCGINPFACILLVESWKGHPNPKPVAFLVRGVPFAMGYDPHALEAQRDALLAACELWDQGFEEGEEFTPEQYLAWVNKNRAAARAAIAKAKGA